MKRRALLTFFALTFGLMWGLGACFALFPAQLTAVFGKISVAPVTSHRSLPRRLSPNGSNFLFFGTSRNVRSESLSPTQVRLLTHVRQAPGDSILSLAARMV